MSFWANAYKWGWADINLMRQAVDVGEITPEEFYEITGEEFEQD